MRIGDFTIFEEPSEAAARKSQTSACSRTIGRAACLREGQIGNLQKTGTLNGKNRGRTERDVSEVGCILPLPDCARQPPWPEATQCLKTSLTRTAICRASTLWRESSGRS